MWMWMRVGVRVNANVDVRVCVRRVPLLLGTGCAVERCPLPDPLEEDPWVRARCVCGYAEGAAAERSE